MLQQVHPMKAMRTNQPPALGLTPLLDRLVRTRRDLGAFAALAAALLASTVKAAVIVTPSGQSSTGGNYGNAAPFDILGLEPSQRYQQVYSASEFSGLRAGGEFITQIAFRPNASLGAAFSRTLPDIRIDLSTTSSGPDALSYTFASNVGADDTIVYGGPTGSALSLSSSFAGPSGGPMNFDIIINLTTPFFYDPAAGNLLLDVRNFGGGATTLFDAQMTAGDSVSRVGTWFSFGVDSPTANFRDTLGLVTQFTTVPEPTAPGFLGLGLLGLSLFRRRYRT